MTSGALARTECPDGEHWVDSHFRSAYVRYDGVHVSAAQVRGHCRKNPRGYTQWHERLANKRPAIWGHGIEKSKKWTVDEVQRFYNELSALPDQLINLKNVKVYRMDQSVTQSNPATSNFKDIVLYDGAFRHKDSLAQILSHELSHVIYSNFSKKEKGDFKQVAGWVKHKDDSDIYVASKNKVFIQPDSKTSISEDFANHLEHYLFKNDLLKNESPAAYKWIQNKFGDDFKVKVGGQE